MIRDEVTVHQTMVDVTVTDAFAPGESFKVNRYLLRASFTDHHARYNAVGFGSSIEAAVAALYADLEEKYREADRGAG